MSEAVVVAPCHLYHLYDASGRLLYVGMTGDVDARMEQHAKAQTWWPLVDHRWVVTYPSRSACAAAEALTIHLLRPTHNLAVPAATRCAGLAARSGTEIPAAVDVVVAVDEQRRRAERAEAKVRQLEAAVERIDRRVKMKDRKLRDVMNEIRRGHRELHALANLAPAGRSQAIVYGALHDALCEVKARCNDTVGGREPGAPRDHVSKTMERLQRVWKSEHEVVHELPVGTGWE